MKRSLIIAILTLSLLAYGQNYAIKGKTVYTMAGAAISDGLVLIKEGRIEAVGSADKLKIPNGYEVFEGAVVTPGLIDAHTVVGLSGYLNQPHDQDQLEGSAPIQPELRAIDAYNARENLVDWLRQHGVTTIHTGHGPGALISGQTMIVKTWGDTVDEAMVKPQAMLAATLGESALVEKKSPGSRGKMMAMLRNELLAAQAYSKKSASADEDKKPPRDLGKEVLVQVLKGELPMMITVDRSRDILNALRLAEEFGIKIVIDSGAEAYMLTDEIKKSGFPVFIHPTMKRSFGEAENMTMEAAHLLREADIPIAFQSGYEGYVPKTRVVLFEAAIAAANGLGMEAALAVSTIEAAKILGIDKRVGSLEKGKDADVVVFDGDPFEYLTHVTQVFINGKHVSEKTR